MRQFVRSPGGNQQKVIIGKWLMLRQKNQLDVFL
jgi:ABC-type sugar transport system ATPase subunit